MSASTTVDAAGGSQRVLKTQSNESSVALLERGRAGDAQALDILFARYLPVLNRWAAGRLPVWARDLADTRDLVQDALVGSLKHLNRIEVRGPGALAAYVRAAILNRVRMEIRRAGRRPHHEELDLQSIDRRRLDVGLSPLDVVLGHEDAERYERALAQLPADYQEAIVARLESGCDYTELAVLLGKPTTGAARLVARRAVLKLAALMRPPR
jgi:RNA polymerase sigma-70 factor, ECF subfamily